MAARDQPPQDCPGPYTDLDHKPPKQDAIHGPRPSQASEQTTCPTTCRMARKWEPRSAPAPPRQCHRGSPSNLPVAATLARSPPRWSPSMSRSVNADRGGFCPRLCAALLGFRRRACLRMPCDAILCEFWVCDEMGSLSSSRLDAPTGCEVRFCLANAELSLLGSFGFWHILDLCGLRSEWRLPRLCAALLGFRRRVCLRLPCEAIWCEFWVCDEMGSLLSSRIDAPTGCEVRFCLAKCQAWLYWLLGTYTIFADYALSGVYPGSVQPCLGSLWVAILTPLMSSLVNFLTCAGFVQVLLYWRCSLFQIFCTGWCSAIDSSQPLCIGRCTFRSLYIGWLMAS